MTNYNWGRLQKTTINLSVAVPVTFANPWDEYYSFRGDYYSFNVEKFCAVSVLSNLLFA